MSGWGGKVGRGSMANIEHKAFKVVRAAVDLVCSPHWSPATDEERALEQVLRDIGWITDADPKQEPSDETAES